MTPKRAALRWLVRPEDEVDWDAVYADLLPRIYNFFRYRLPDSALAEDLTASTLERAWQGRARYRHHLSDFPTWVFGIARHVAADHFRRRDPTLPLERLDTQAADAGLDEYVQQQHQVERLRALLAQLSEREREIIALKYGADLSNREIASVMKLSETNVSTLAHRIVARLRTEWENDDR